MVPRAFVGGSERRGRRGSDGVNKDLGFGEGRWPVRKMEEGVAAATVVGGVVAAKRGRSARAEASVALTAKAEGGGRSRGSAAVGQSGGGDGAGGDGSGGGWTAHGGRRSGEGGGDYGGDSDVERTTGEGEQTIATDIGHFTSQPLKINYFDCLQPQS
ncbi:glycine-rich cell wall structural protein 1.8-like [Phoenix dactylifera]|uniref:Glycine-rich cell wall structural protein 1.8-like n=1 Tax=Phoenix dactylifera TaxID=42345 RepID=A0A8B9AMD2_PHODC|nr:glycine-rich cell wall structural protein 1.8-like [Phoenix dactylifera]